MSGSISQRTDKLVPIHFEPFSLGKFLRGCVGSDDLIEDFQHIVYIFVCVGHMESTVVDTR